MPDNAGYYHAAYVAGAIIYVGYGFALWWRGRRLARRAEGLYGSATKSATR